MQQQQARTRAVLAALGIPLWAVRGEPVQNTTAISVWGIEGESSSVAVPDEMVQPNVVQEASITFPKSQSVAVQVGSKAVQAQAEVTANTLTNLPVKTIQPDQKPVRQPFTQPIVASEAVHVVQVLRFSLEARVIGNWVVLVSVQALNHPDRNALWKNLNQALVSSDHVNEVGRLDWPLAEGARWQHNDGAQAALMGFLSRFGSERRIGLMGELPDHVIPEQLERLPSLDELLQEPLKKRTLWRLLTGSIR